MTGNKLENKLKRMIMYQGSSCMQNKKRNFFECHLYKARTSTLTFGVKVTKLTTTLSHEKMRPNASSGFMACLIF